MILELMEWCFTPASIRARTSGLLAGQIAIRHRARRCRKEWSAHLQSSKTFVKRHLSSCGHVAILGSGHLRDFDIGHLKQIFSRVTLVDAVHPIEVRILALFSKERIKLVSADLSGAIQSSGPESVFALEPELDRVLRSADVLVSSCLLSQLALAASHRWSRRHSSLGIESGVRRIQQNHIDLLRNAPQALLITDTARRYGEGDWSPLLGAVDLPLANEHWLWDIAPVAEHGLRKLGAEQRRVEGFAFSHHENLCPIALSQ